MSGQTAAGEGGEAVTGRLAPDALCRRCAPARFGFATTAELEGLLPLASQDRAHEAVSFGSAMGRRGYNLIVIGPSGSGKHGSVRDFLKARAASAAVPSDWVYVNNFDEAFRPIALELPPGRAGELRRSMEELIEDLRVALPAAFETDDYQNRRGAIDEGFRTSQEQALEELNREAREAGIAVMRTPNGFAMAPAPGGEVMKPEVFNALGEDERKRYETRIKALQEKLAGILKAVPRQEKQRRAELRTINREFAERAVGHSIEELKGAFKGLMAVHTYLDEVHADLVENAALFLAGEEERSPFAGSAVADGRFDRYRVNVMVSREGAADGAPVVAEDHPTLGNLVGRVEHVQSQGALVTNFRLIKPGALHQGNGGYVLIDLKALLSEPLAWDALKRALRQESIRIESLGERLSLINTVSLEPDPIPLNVKVVLFADRALYYLLSQFDTDIDDLFKVVADFEDDMTWDDGGEDYYARLVAAVAKSEELRPLDPGAVARSIEEAARAISDARRLSLRITPLADLLREADFIAGEEGTGTVSGTHVDKAAKARLRRADRIREASQEAILRDIALIDTDGAAVGQINGLAVLSLGHGTFGRPSRITARVRMGTGRLVDIEREVELGGALHSKGVLILSGFLQARYALEVPMSLAASLVFEQSYGGVDGDSASSAELYALLSALAEAPIDQSFAVTGSVNQLGHVQAIGGVNHKIEGFFDICSERGLTGRQGVLIPASNVQHLMLREDVVEACAKGSFAVHSVATIDEGIEILTGLKAGARGADGLFADGTINRRIEDRLVGFAEARRKFGIAGRRPDGEAAGDVGVLS